MAEVKPSKAAESDGRSIERHIYLPRLLCLNGDLYQRVT